jgi:hypothetical protein
MRTMTFGQCDGYLVTCHTTLNPTRDEWVEHLLHIREHVANLRGTLIVTAGGAPNSAQRKDLADVVGKRKIPVAIVTASPTARAVITAFAWLGMYHGESFRPDRMEDALDYLSVDPAKRPLVLAEVARLQDRLAQAHITRV